VNYEFHSMHNELYEEVHYDILDVGHSEDFVNSVHVRHIHQDHQRPGFYHMLGRHT
ncbi:MAG: hypothetical protein M1813_009389, partial [Trichoglossum hirsutum]